MNSVFDFHFNSGIQYDRVLLVTTDAASYMISAMNSLKTLFPKMLHLTCFAHGLHRVAEFIRTDFELVNSLVAKVKSVFVKVKFRFIIIVLSITKGNILFYLGPSSPTKIQGAKPECPFTSRACAYSMVYVAQGGVLLL